MVYMRKVIKKILYVVISLLILVLIIPALVYILLQFKPIQNYTRLKIENVVSQRIQMKFKVESISMAMDYKIILNHPAIIDENRDTFFHANRILARIKYLDTQDKQININRCIVEKADIKITQDADYKLNISSLIAALTIPKDSTKKNKPWKLEIDRLQFFESTFIYKNYYRYDAGKAINFSDLHFTNLDFALKNFTIIKDTILFGVNKISFKDKSGFVVDNLMADMSLSKRHVHFYNLYLSTPFSQINAPSFKMNFENFKAFSKIGTDVIFDVNLSRSKFSFIDVCYIIKSMRGYNDKMELAGGIFGTVDNLKGKGVELYYGRNAYFKGNASIDGLPDVSNLFMYLDIKKAVFDYFDVQRFTNEFLPQKNIKIPESIKKFGFIHYKGSYTGFFNDFVAFGNFKSAIGVLKTDIMLKPSAGENLFFQGRVSSEGFDVGKITGTEKYAGLMKFDLLVDGSNTGNEESVTAQIDGKVYEFVFNKYKYESIVLKGLMTNKSYDGNLTINDPNIKFLFNGKVDFSKKIPEFHFDGDLQHANLYKLNFDKKDSLHQLTMFITADIKGNAPENLNGVVSLKYAKFKKTNKELLLENISLFAVNNESTNKLLLKSSYVDAQFSGVYRAPTILNSIKHYLATYLPVLFSHTHSNIDESNSLIDFTLKLKHTSPISDYFFPGYYTSDNTMLYGHYMPRKNKISLIALSKEIHLKNRVLYGFMANIHSNDTAIKMELGIENLVAGKKFQFKNFTFNAAAFNNQVGFQTRWNTWDSIANKALVSGMGTFSRVDSLSKPIMDIRVNPIDMVLRNIDWKIDSSSFRLSSDGLVINSFKAKHETQFINVNGAISRLPEDSLFVKVNDIQVEYFNLLLPTDKLYFSGYASGKAAMSGLFSKPVFISNIVVEKLLLNEEPLGKTRLIAEWDDTYKRIKLSLNSRLERLNTVKLNGYYYPENSSIDVVLQLDKVNPVVLAPFMTALVYDVSGMATGALFFHGPLASPDLSGKVKLLKTSFNVNFLKGRYSTTADVLFDKTKIEVEKAIVFDANGNKAILDATVNHKFFRDMTFKSDILANNFIFLDTKASDNIYFYGKAIGSGTINISGNTNNINIIVNATSDKNTLINIPFRYGNEVEVKRFISFKNKKSLSDTLFFVEKPITKANLSGINMQFYFTVTPDAEVQIIFDPKMGDIIKGTGSGNITMELNTLGKLKMYGSYTIDEGDYLFTLKNVINKKLKVERGGQIEWTGDPIDANIDLKANYRTRSALYNVIPEVSDEYKNRIPIDCQVQLTGKLLNPIIRYDIILPYANEETKNKLKSVLNTETELAKQFLSLIVFNSFYANAYKSQEATTSTDASIMMTEFLSNQLSNWLSSGEWDVGVNYRVGNASSSSEVELALSRQLFNDRISVQGNIGYGGVSSTNSTTGLAPQQNYLTGDLNVDVKLTKNGKLLARAFNRANDQYALVDFEQSLHKQGVGIVYKEEFDTFSELLKRYYKAIFVKKTIEPKEK